MEAIQNEEQEEKQVEDLTTTTTQSSIKQISRKFTFAICLLLILAMCIFWLISSFNTQNLLRQQADGLGQSLAHQTAAQLTELILANDYPVAAYGWQQEESGPINKPFQYSFWHHDSEPGWGNVAFLDNHIDYFRATYDKPDFQNGRNWTFLFDGPKR